MKFILLSNVATLAVLATAPGASAAGLRARTNQHGGKDDNADASTSNTQDDKTRENSGRRNLYGYMPNPGNFGIPYGMNIPGMSQGEASYAPYGLPSASNFGRPSGMLQGEDETQYEPQVKTGPGSVPVSEAVFARYCRSLSDEECNSTQGCSNYCAAKSVHVSEAVFSQYCKSLSDDECNSTQGCSNYCAANSDIDEPEWGNPDNHKIFIISSSSGDAAADRNWFCGKIKTQDKCEQHDRDHHCGWDEHHYPRCHVY